MGGLLTWKNHLVLLTSIRFCSESVVYVKSNECKGDAKPLGEFHALAKPHNCSRHHKHSF